MNDAKRIDGSLIVPRRIPFEFPDDIQPTWIPGEPELSHMINGASLTMPYLEPFLIRTIREALPQISEPGLRADAEAFIAQEGMHFRAHRRFNDVLKRNGYPELAEVEAAMDASYARLAKRSLTTRLAYTAGFEAMTIGVTNWLVKERRALFLGADTRVVSFVLWHMVEETEHKTVAFDVYQATQTSVLRRAFGVLHGSFDVMRFSMRGYKAMLRKDGLWTNLRSRLRLAAWLSSFIWHIAPSMLRALLPGHDPRKEADLEWTLEWLRRHAETGGAAGLPLIDTQDPEMPVPFPSPLPRAA